MFSLSGALEAAGYTVDPLNTALRETFRRAVAGLAKGAQNEWVRLAQSRLRTSRAEYINGLRQGESFMINMVDGEPLYTIQLVGELPNDFEFGRPAFDMKAVRPGWLGGGKAKTAADGHKYIIIPMRHSTTSNSNIGYTGKAQAAGMQTQLRAAVKDYGLDRMIRMGGAIASGPVSRIPNNAAVHPYLKGLTRVQSSRSGERHAQLVTWRIMSENGDADSWIHPGLKPANLLRDVERWVDQQMTNIVENVMRSA